MPSFLHQRNQEVDGHGQVLSNVVLTCLNIANSGSQARSLLRLELDGVLELINFGGDLLSFSKGDWESVHLDQDVAQKFGGLLSDGIAGQKDIILLGPFFNFCLILVKSLETVNINERDSVGSCLLNVCSVSENANLNEKKSTLMLL